MKITLGIDWNHFITGGGALLLFLSVFCVVGSVYTLLHGGNQDSWNQTTGTITLSRVERTQPGKPTRELFAYQYRVNGETYKSQRYSLGSVGGDKTLGVKLYSPGDIVTVYYNPQNPSVAVLLKQRPGLPVYLVLVFGLLFFLASMGSLLARDATALFSRSRAIQLWEQLTCRREETIKRLVKANTSEDLDTLVDALQNPLLRECLNLLTNTAGSHSTARLQSLTDPSALDPENIQLAKAVRHLHLATGIEMKTCREMMRVLAQRRSINLSREKT